LLELDPARRYQTARELHEDLQRHLDHQPLRHMPEEVSERARKWLRRNPRVPNRLLAAAVLLTVALARVFGLRSWALTHTQQALDRFAAFRRRLPEIQFLLQTPSNDLHERQRGLELARQEVNHYEVQSHPHWRSLPLFASLPREAQATL
jgi:hypothetical protein